MKLTLVFMAAIALAAPAAELKDRGVIITGPLLGPDGTGISISVDAGTS